MNQRRTKGSGSIRKLPSGKFQARSRSSDGALEPAPVTFETQIEAEIWLNAHSDGVWTNYPLETAGMAWRRSKKTELARAAELDIAIREYCEGGGTEVQAALLAGVDRMTVRRALGKL